MPPDLTLHPHGGEPLSMADQVTMFHLVLVVLDPYTIESSVLLKTAGRILEEFAGADCRGFITGAIGIVAACSGLSRLSTCFVNSCLVRVSVEFAGAGLGAGSSPAIHETSVTRLAMTRAGASHNLIPRKEVGSNSGAGLAIGSVLFRD